MSAFIPTAEAIRLMREAWPDATMLAQELFALLTSNLPADAPIPVAKQPGNGQQPVFTVGGFSNGDTLFEITGAQGQPFGSILIQDGALVFAPPFSGEPPQAQDSGTQPLNPRGPGQLPGTTRPQPQAAATGVFPGVVVSGSGDTYQCNVYLQGRRGEPTLLAVKQLQIAPGEVIPAGSWAPICKAPDGEYFMQMPVWLGAPP